LCCKYVLPFPPSYARLGRGFDIREENFNTGPMRVISVAIQKGGAGKTTTTHNLGAALRKLGFRTLLIDLDPQSSLTQAMGIANDGIWGIGHALKKEGQGESVSLEKYVHRIGEQEIIPANTELGLAEMELVTVYGRELLLKRLLHTLDHAYDFVLLDCPPSMGILTANALVACQDIILPLQAEFLPLKGLESFLQHAEQLRKSLNTRLDVLGMLFTQYKAGHALTRKIEQQVSRAYKGKAFQTVIPTDITLAEAQEERKDIFTYAPESEATKAYSQLAEEVLARLLRESPNKHKREWTLLPGGMHPRRRQQPARVLHKSARVG